MGRLDLALRSRVAGSFTLAAQRWYDGSYAVRDGFLLATIDVVNKPTRVLRVKPGVTLPIGGVSAGLSVTPLTTGSFDPWLQVDALVGGTWIGGATLTVRAPVFEGSDAVRQGVRSRLDLKGARRLGPGVGWFGATGVVQGGGQVRPDSTLELNLAGGWVHELNPSWVLGIDARLPVYFSPNMGSGHYVAALGLTVTRASQSTMVKPKSSAAGAQGHEHGGGPAHDTESTEPVEPTGDEQPDPSSEEGRSSDDGGGEEQSEPSP